MICFYKGNFFALSLLSSMFLYFYILRQSPFFLLIFLLLLSPFLFLPLFFYLLLSPPSSLSVDIQQIQWGKHGAWRVCCSYHLQIERWRALSHKWDAMLYFPSELQFQCCSQASSSGWHNFWKFKTVTETLQSKNRIYFYVTGLHFLPFLYSLWFNRKF